jgi:aspartyl protease family protein
MTDPPPRDRETAARRAAARGRGTPKGGVSIGRILLLVSLVVLAYWLGQRQGVFAPVATRLTDAAPAAESPRWLAPACNDAFPPAGTVAAAPQWLREASGQSVTTFANRTATDRVVDLLQGEQVLASIAVPAHAEVAVALPVGTHGWRLRNGAAWCSKGWRFVREQRTVISPPLEIVAASQLTVDISPAPDEPTGFALATRDAPVVSTAPAATASTEAQGGGDVLRVPRSPNGHYFIDGMVDSEPVRFLIDTGASRVALPVTLARRLGYYEGREITVSTASGQSIASEFKVRRISFGPFVAEDVTVVALMNLETPLLGMALLQSIELRQTAAGLELRRAR